MGGKTRAVKGHELGLHLSPQEKAALIAISSRAGIETTSTNINHSLIWSRISLPGAAFYIHVDGDSP